MTFENLGKSFVKGLTGTKNVDVGGWFFRGLSSKDSNDRLETGVNSFREPYVRVSALLLSCVWGDT